MNIDCKRSIHVQPSPARPTRVLSKIPERSYFNGVLKSGNLYRGIVVGTGESYLTHFKLHFSISVYVAHFVNVG